MVVVVVMVMRVMAFKYSVTERRLSGLDPGRSLGVSFWGFSTTSVSSGGCSGGDCRVYFHGSNI